MRRRARIGERLVHEHRLALIDGDPSQVKVQSAVSRDHEHDVGVGDRFLRTRSDVRYRNLLRDLASASVVFAPNGVNRRGAVLPVVWMARNVQVFRKALSVTIVRAQNGDLCHGHSSTDSM